MEQKYFVKLREATRINNEVIASLEGSLSSWAKGEVDNLQLSVALHTALNRLKVLNDNLNEIRFNSLGEGESEVK